MRAVLLTPPLSCILSQLNRSLTRPRFGSRASRVSPSQAWRALAFSWVPWMLRTSSRRCGCSGSSGQGAWPCLGAAHVADFLPTVLGFESPLGVGGLTSPGPNLGAKARLLPRVCSCSSSFSELVRFLGFFFRGIGSHCLLVCSWLSI